jgi:hypothetical protein
VSLVQFHGGGYLFSAHQKEKRLREGGVGPEIRSPAGLVATILSGASFYVKAESPTLSAVFA